MAVAIESGAVWSIGDRIVVVVPISRTELEGARLARDDGWRGSFTAAGSHPQMHGIRRKRATSGVGLCSSWVAVMVVGAGTAIRKRWRPGATVGSRGETRLRGSMPKAQHSGPEGVSRTLIVVVPLGDLMKKYKVGPKHINLAEQSVTLVATRPAGRARIMKVWEEEHSITETELQDLVDRPDIVQLEIWPSETGYFLTLKFKKDVTLPPWDARNLRLKARRGRHFFLSVRRVRTAPRTFKDLNRLRNFIEGMMPEVKLYSVHQNPTIAKLTLVDTFAKYKRSNQTGLDS